MNSRFFFERISFLECVVVFNLFSSARIVSLVHASISLPYRSVCAPNVAKLTSEKSFFGDGNNGGVSKM